MLSNLFAAVFLPTLLLAAPTARDTTCTPSSYTISNFSLNPTPPNQHVHFVFTSSFSDTSNIIDLATKGAVCDAAAGNDGNFPNEIACSTGRTNVEVGLRGPESSAKYQVIHFWTCGGKNWMSSTPVDVDIAKGGQVFSPQNVREVPCGTPTCS